MYIDIHKHGNQINDNTIIVRNLFPEQLSEIQSGRVYSIGIHPWHINNKDIKGSISTIDRDASKNEVIAIGETGLDQKVTISYLDQINVFEQQIEIAEKHHLPVIIHCVKAYNDIITIRKKTNKAIPWIIHWFNASEQIAIDLIKLNCYLSFGYMLFKENSKAYKVFSNISLDNVFLETDDTEYTIEQVYEKAMAIKNINLEKLMLQIEINYKTCFNIK